MVYIGMVFRCDSEDKSGHIMYSDGEKREFNATHWVDTENLPAVGQKVSYEASNNRIEIKVVDNAEQITESPVEVLHTHQETGEELSSVDDYINYYTNMGFKEVRRPKDNESDTITLRLYTSGDYGEVIIKTNGSQLSVKQTINGETTLVK